MAGGAPAHGGHTAAPLVAQYAHILAGPRPRAYGAGACCAGDARRGGNVPTSRAAVARARRSLVVHGRRTAGVGLLRRARRPRAAEARTTPVLTPPGTAYARTQAWQAQPPVRRAGTGAFRGERPGGDALGRRPRAREEGWVSVLLPISRGVSPESACIMRRRWATRVAGRRGRARRLGRSGDKRSRHSRQQQSNGGGDMAMRERPRQHRERNTVRTKYRPPVANAVSSRALHGP